LSYTPKQRGYIAGDFDPVTCRFRTFVLFCGRNRHSSPVPEFQPDLPA